MSQSRTEAARQAQHLGDEGRELEELVHRQATALAVAPQFGEADLVASSTSDPLVGEQQGADLGPLCGVV